MQTSNPPERGTGKPWFESERKSNNNASSAAFAIDAATVPVGARDSIDECQTKSVPV